MGSVISKVKVLRIAVKQVLALSASYERLQQRIQSDPGLPVQNPTHSFWHDKLSPIATHVLDALPAYVDVVIIGSGITGTSTARTLFHEGHDDLSVLMLEARETCSGATGRNGGHIKPPLYDDFLTLKKKYGVKEATKLVRFRLMHIREMLAVAREEDILDECGCREVDSLDVYFSSKKFEEAKNQVRAWKNEMPEEAKDYSWVEGEEAIKKFGLSSEITGVIYSNAGAVHPYNFVTNILARLVKQHQGRFYLSTSTPCTAIQVPSGPSSRPLYRVETPRGTVLTQHVVHATNAWASHLLPQMRAKIFCVRGNMTAQRPGDALSSASLDGHRSWVFYDRHLGYDYLTQLPNGERELMFGGGFVPVGEDGLGEVGCSDDSQFNVGIAVHLAGALPLLFGGKNWGREVLPSSDTSGKEDSDWFRGRLKAVWSGIIGISADRLPWVGRIPPKLTGRDFIPPPPPSATKLDESTVLQGEKEDSEKQGVRSSRKRTAPPGEWIAAGYSGEGMAHAFLCGRAVAMQVLGRADEAAIYIPDCLSVTETRWAKAHAEDLIEELWG